MKTLYIIRHAKSSWDLTDLDDFSRPLSERGEKDAPRMGKRLKEKSVIADAIITSPAVRALSTAEKIAKTLDFPPGVIHQNKKMYHASADTLLYIILGIADKNDCVFMVGHNPGLTEFSNALQEDERIDNLPTAGVMAIAFDAESWSSIKWGSGKLLFFDFPKNAD